MKKYSAGLPDGSRGDAENAEKVSTIVSFSAFSAPPRAYRVAGPAPRSGYLTRSKLFSICTGDCSSLGCAEGNGRARARKFLVVEYGPESCNSLYLLAQVNA